MMMISQKMCSSVCPCSSKLVSDETKYLQDVETTYMSIPEPTLNQYGRTKQNKEGYIPLVFNGTYSTFEECIKFNLARMLNNNFTEYDMSVLFRVDFQPDRANVNDSRPNLFGDSGNAIQNSIGYDVFEFEAAAAIEEEFECSGICTPALFYFTQPTYKGRPTETCLTQIRYEI